jgi:integrase/recombinase XerD
VTDDALRRLVDEHDSWLAGERGLARNSLLAYRRDLRRYVEWLRMRGVDDPAQIGEADVAAYVEHLQRARDDEGRPRAAPASVARAVAAVRSLHRFAAAEDVVVIDSAVDVRAPRVPRGLPKALTEDEVAALLDAVTGDAPARSRDRAMLETLYAGGLRISELVALDLDALDLDAGFVRAFGKGAKERLVPLGRRAEAALRDYVHQGRPLLRRQYVARRGDADAVFLNGRGGRLTRQGCWKIVRGYGERAGLGERLWPHQLRHSCATHMLDHGADVRVVQELLGHASVSTTQLYTKVYARRLRAVYDAAHPRARPASSANP